MQGDEDLGHPRLTRPSDPLFGFQADSGKHSLGQGRRSGEHAGPSTEPRLWAPVVRVL